MFFGTTIEDLMKMVENVEANAETHSMMRKQLEQAQLLPAPYEPIVRNVSVIGVA